MDGFSSHTLKFVNSQGEVHFVKWHFKTDQKIKNFTAEQSEKLAGSDPDYATRDLFNAIEKGNFPSWTVYVQIMSAKDAATYRWNPLDVTKVWPHKDYPLVPLGRLVLNRNPENYFAETEQSAFSPSHMVPGIEPSADKMLQGRLFSYPDTHRHRLGPNYQQIPVNVPHNCPVRNHQRDGLMTVNGNQGSALNYEPNSFEGPKQVGSKNPMYTPFGNPSDSLCARHNITLTDDDFKQAGALYRLQCDGGKERLVANIVGHLKNAKKFIQKRQVEHFKRADPEYGRRIENGLLKASKYRF